MSVETMLSVLDCYGGVFNYPDTEHRTPFVYSAMAFPSKVNIFVVRGGRVVSFWRISHWIHVLDMCEEEEAILSDILTAHPHILDVDSLYIVRKDA